MEVHLPFPGEDDLPGVVADEVRLVEASAQVVRPVARRVAVDPVPRPGRQGPLPVVEPRGESRSVMEEETPQAGAAPGG